MASQEPVHQVVATDKGLALNDLSTSSLADSHRQQLELILQIADMLPKAYERAEAALLKAMANARDQSARRKLDTQLEDVRKKYLDEVQQLPEALEGIQAVAYAQTGALTVGETAYTVNRGKGRMLIPKLTPRQTGEVEVPEAGQVEGQVIKKRNLGQRIVNFIFGENRLYP